MFLGSSLAHPSADLPSLAAKLSGQRPKHEAHTFLSRTPIYIDSGITGDGGDLGVEVYGPVKCQSR